MQPFELGSSDFISENDFYFNADYRSYMIDLTDYDAGDVSSSELNLKGLYPLDDSTEAVLYNFEDNVSCALHDWVIGNKRLAAQALLAICTLEAIKERSTTMRVVLELMHGEREDDMNSLLLAASECYAL